MTSRSSPKKMASHTSIYLLGDILRHSVSLIMLPIYTRYLTPEDYGTIELLSMLIDFTAVIFGVRAAESIFRFYCTTDVIADKNNIISSALTMGLLTNGLGALTIAYAAIPLSNLIFSSSDYSSVITLFALTLALMPLIEIPLTQIRAEQKPWLFFTFSIAKLIIQLSLNLYFVVSLEMHVEGVIYSAVISSAVLASILSVYTLAKVGICPSWQTCKRLFSFSLPLKIATLATFYLTFGDRYFLNSFTSLEQVGLYALGYKFGFIFIMISWQPFEKMWDTEKYLIHKQSNAIQKYQSTFLYINFILIFIGLGIAVFTKDLLKIMSDPAFLNAYQIVPIIILAYIFQAWSKFCNMGILIEKKTMQIAYAEIIASIIITIAYLLLIPEYGMHGAAWATAIGFFFRFLWVHVQSLKLYNMRLPWEKVCFTGAIAIMAYFLSLYAPEDLLQSILARSGIMLLFIAAFALLPILSREEKQLIYNKTVVLILTKIKNRC